MKTPRESQAMAGANRISLDKYYTPVLVAKKCMSLLHGEVSPSSITEYLEPSAGGGVFLSLFKGVPFKAFDILPEHEIIKKADYLKVNIGYKKGRCIVGNPPFGRSLNTARLFYKKAITEGDYVAFILPTSQYKNEQFLTTFKLILSVKLGEVLFSNKVTVDSCFNVYKRVNTPIIPTKYSVPTVGIKSYRRGITQCKSNLYDVAIIASGRRIGTIIPVLDKDKYSKVILLSSNNHFTDQIKHIINTHNWHDYCMKRGPFSLPNWRLLKVLSESKTWNHERIGD